MFRLNSKQKVQLVVNSSIGLANIYLKKIISIHRKIAIHLNTPREHHYIKI